MPIANFRVKRPRPRKLSDPTDDFSPEDCRKLLAVPDNKLQVKHYRDLLGPNLPAGTYEETVYFSPLAFRHILAHDADAFELVTPIIGFVSQCKGQLAKDKILDEARACILECLTHWTKDFVIIHLDENACRERGMGRKYFDYVQNSGVVTSAIGDLVRFGEHSDIAIDFIEGLANHGTDSVKAAWFLEYAHYKPKPAQRPAGYEPILQLVTELGRLREAANVVRQNGTLFALAPTYWRDTFKALNT